MENTETYIDKNKILRYYNQLCFNKKLSELFSNITQRRIECQKIVKDSTNYIKKTELLKLKELSLLRKHENIKLKRNSSIPTFSIFKMTKCNSTADNTQRNSIPLNQSITLINSNSSRNLKNSLNLNNEIQTKEEKNDLKNKNISNKRNFRVKNFKVEYIKDWEINEGLIETRNNKKNILNDIEYQKQIISNEIMIILDNFEKFNPYIKQLSREIKSGNINENFIKKLNIQIETTSALLMKIGHLIIRQYEYYIYENEKKKPINPKMKGNYMVKNEKNEFSKNLIIFNESINFLNCTFHIYNSIMNQVEIYCIPFKKMVQLRQFLSRGRYGIGNIIFTVKQYLKEIKFADNLYYHYNLIMSNKNNKYDNNQISFSEYIKNQKFDISESNVHLLREKNNRLEHLFDKDNKSEKKSRSVFNTNKRIIKEINPLINNQNEFSYENKINVINI